MPARFAPRCEIRQPVANANLEHLLERHVHAGVAADHAVVAIHERSAQHDGIRALILAVPEQIGEWFETPIARA